MRIQIVGAGRMGTALAAELRRVRYDVDGPVGRGATGEGADLVLLAVPDDAIADAAARIADGPIVGHLSGVTGLEALHPHEALSLHPLTTVSGPGHRFSGTHAAIAGSTARALTVAEELAAALDLDPFIVRDEDRAAYHAAAAIASNFLVTVEGFAEDLARTAGVSRGVLAPLVRAAVTNWFELGARGALTGPIVRGDTQTVERHREAVQQRTPEHADLFDTLVRATERLAAAPGVGIERQETASSGHVLHPDQTDEPDQAAEPGQAAVPDGVAEPDQMPEPDQTSEPGPER